MAQEVGTRIYRQACDLAFPRYPGTEGDRRAIELVAARMGAAGLDVAIERFSYDLSRVWLALRSVLLLGCLALVAAGLTATTRPWIALGVLAAAIGLALSLLGWSPWLERLYARSGPTRTANVVGRWAAGRVRRRVVVMAHHDSKSQNLTMLARGALTVVALIASLVVGGTAVVGVLQIWAPGAWVSGTAGVIGGLCLLVLSTLRSGNLSPGGVDNAGSLALLLELADTLPGVVGDETELVFLSTGAEEDHMVGAMRWLDRHEESLSVVPTVALNMDGVGAPGRLVLLERYGFGRLFSPRLSRLARDVARELSMRPRGVLMPPAMGIDSIPFANHGIECLTISSGSLDRATLSVHSAHDRAEHLAPEVLERGYRLVLEMVLRIAEMPSIGEPSPSRPRTA